jgi:hypothetical protein
MNPKTFSVLVAFLGAGAAPALAQVEIQSVALSGNPSVVNFTPFNPKLGTLRDVQISIDGLYSLEFTGNAGAAATAAALGVPTPVPIVFAIQTQFLAVAPVPFGGFTTDITNPDSTTGLTWEDGTGDSTFAFVPVDYGFDFSKGTDALGFTVDSQGNFQDATLSDFVASPSGPPIELATSAAQLYGAEFDPLAGSYVVVAPDTVDLIEQLSLEGAMTIQYDYMPATAPGSAVPDEAGVLVPRLAILFPIGLAYARGRRAGYSLQV